MTNQVTYLFFHGMEQISEYLFTTEEQAVIARSKAEGSYMVRVTISRHKL